MLGEAATGNLPVPTADLTKIATQACDSALQNVQSYDHEQVSKWSSQIINEVLQSLIQATTPEESTPTPPTSPYRFNVNCTIIQQGVASPEAAESIEKAGKRGMYSASGAYWDVKLDGMWTFKYPNAEDKGLDLVLNIVWFGTK
ncbi:hypothetical protein PAAG_03129 [Paracoccidioides lutzii Pb01]|uniref:Dynein light chain n=1 Tax=Paracoccidioides lutzii (strain ATCC MYA-826 / Pb01) TaxID=502779 RepID=C1GYH5_PARBA|nr:hypothetical protein PAAG_03129 [Paracoccidioides lutzii Pb01]EEH41566.1 hypothetical protein PAAG_03129 [Paracoccidioides lutzii Pb01]